MYTRDISTPVSRSFVYKKVTKPLLERRRRARMSKCLDELKVLMIEQMKLNADNVNRLEKADILEMTVQHLQRLREKNSAHRYQEGFNECAIEACHFLETVPGVDSEVSERLVEHLEVCTGPLTIQLPQYKLTFSPPVSPSTPLGSNHPFKNSPSLSQLEVPSPGLLMKVDVKAAVYTPLPKPLTYTEKVQNFWSCHPPIDGMVTPSSASSWSSSSSEMWRPW